MNYEKGAQQGNMNCEESQVTTIGRLRLLNALRGDCYADWSNKPLVDHGRRQ
jgi:hypothetical protein